MKIDHVEQPRDWSDPPLPAQVAAYVSRYVAARLVAAALDTIARFAFLLVAVLLVPFGLVVLAATGLAFGAILTVLGTPTGPVGAALGITWFGGSLAIAFVIMRRVYRALPASVHWLLTFDEQPDPLAGPLERFEGELVERRPAAPGAVDRKLLAIRIRELDACLASPSGR